MLRSLQFEKPPVSLEVFKKLSFQVGTVIKVEPIKKARKPSYEMDAVFETTKKSCGQFMRNFTKDELIQKQILGLTNLGPVRIAGIKSEYLTLGFADDNNDGQAIPLTPCLPIKNGASILIPTLKDANVDNQGKVEAASDKAEYKDFESVEVLSATIIDLVTKDFKSYCIVDFGDDKRSVALVPGILSGELKQYIGLQVPVVTNVGIPVENFDNVESKLFVFSLPLDDSGDKVTLVKIEKPVKNGLNIF